MDIKVLNVTLSSDAEAQALTGVKKPRRRTATRKQRGGAAAVATPESGQISDVGGSVSPVAAAVAEGPVARIEKIDSTGAAPIGITEPVSGEARGAPMIGGGVTTEPISPLAVKLSNTPPVVTMPALSNTTVGGGAPVLIGGKRGISTVATVPIARILPTKRRLTGAPAAQTLKKPKFRIGGGAEETHVDPGVSGVSAGGSSETGVTKIGGAVKQTRRFKARKIKLTVKSSSASKEIRHKVKAKVRSMTTADVRKLLLSKGIIKAPAADKLPEEMLRNMLRDYMLLHNAE